MAYHKRTKVIYIDDEEYVWCSREQDYVIHTEFDFNKKGEYKLFCMRCSDVMYDNRNINYTKGAEDRNQYVQEQSKLMLENIGYDYNSQFTIHEQFLMKHKLI
jgi:hypothetical protein